MTLCLCVHSFEVDAPTTQAEKCQALAEAEIETGHVTFVPVDFTSQDWMVELRAAGFDPSEPTIFLWEGVTYYLTEDIIHATFSRIADCAHALVAYDVYYRWFSIDPRTVKLMSRGYGEPFLSGVDVAGEGVPATEVGLELVEVVRADEANRRYVPHRPDGGYVCPAFSGMAMVMAATASAKEVALVPTPPSSAQSAVEVRPPVPDAAARPAATIAPRASAVQAPPTSAAGVSLQSVMAEVERLTGSQTDVDITLMDAGLDSIMTVELMQTLQAAVGESVELPDTLVFDEPTVRRLVKFISLETGVEGMMLMEDPLQPMLGGSSSMYVAGARLLLPQRGSAASRILTHAAQRASA